MMSSQALSSGQAPAPATPVAVLPPDDIFNQDAIKTVLQDDINSGQLIAEHLAFLIDWLFGKSDGEVFWNETNWY